MSTIERQVMASVALIHTARRLVSWTALKVYVLAASFWGIVVLVHVSAVAANFTNVAQNGVGDTLVYLLTAVFSTNLLVQLALILVVGTLASLLVDIVRSRRGFLA